MDKKEIIWNNQTWIIDSRRILANKELNCLILSDLHIGLYSALRAEGNYLPAYDQDIMQSTLQSLIHDYSSYHWIIAGDIKHNKARSTRISLVEQEELINTLNFIQKNVFQMTLLVGNHDTGLQEFLSIQNRVFTIKDSFSLGDIVITHNIEPSELTKGKLPFSGFNGVIMGHIHPITDIPPLKGFKYPAFVIKTNLIILPAFNYVSGGYPITKLKFSNEERIDIFAIIENKIIEV